MFPLSGNWSHRIERTALDASIVWPLLHGEEHLRATDGITEHEDGEFAG